MGMESEKIASTTSSLRGHIAMFTAAVLWGAMSPVAKSVMLSGAVPPLALSAIRIAGGCIVFWLATIVLPRNSSGRDNIAKSDIPVIIAMSLLIIAANQGLYIVGIGFTTPFEATVMTTMTPVFTMILAMVFLSIPITFIKIAGVAFGLVGALMLAFSNDNGLVEVARSPLLGNIMCLGAQICAAVYFTLFRSSINRYHPFVLLKWLFLAGTVTWVPFTWPSLADIRLDLIDIQLTAEILFIIIFPTFCSYLLMVYAQQKLKPTSVAMYNYIQPLTAAIIASVMGLAVFGWFNILATVMIFAGVALVAFAPAKHRVKKS